jgi:hypothetical protein
MNTRPARRWLALTLALGAALLGSGCGARKLDTAEVQKFVDAADASARRRYAPEICEARANSFQLNQKFLVDGRGGEPHEVHIGKTLFCKQAAGMAKLYQYVMERGPLTITLGADRRTATVEADYVEKMPFYEDGAILASPDIYEDVQVVESHDKSVVGIEDGKIRFLSTDADIYVRLVPKHDMPLPYD